MIGSRTCSRGVTSDVYGCCMFGDLMEVEEKFSIQFFAMGGEPVRWTYQFSLINHPPAELSATIESQSTPLLYVRNTDVIGLRLISYSYHADTM